MGPAIRRRTRGWTRAAAAVMMGLAGAARAAVPHAPDTAPDVGAWQLQLRSAQHSDATRLSQSGDLQGSDVTPRRDRNLAYLDEELRLTREQGAWTWGLTARSRATLVASEDTLRLYRQADGGEPLSANQQWQVDARLRGFSGRGLLIGHRTGPQADTNGATGWRFAAELQALQLVRWRERHITGTASADAAQDTYGFALRSTEQSNRLDFPFQADYPRHGTALLGRVVLGFKAARWRVDASVQDLGWLRWRQLPQQDALLDSRTAGVDGDGFVIYRPLVQGQNSQTDARRTAPAWSSLSAGWQVGAASVAGDGRLDGAGGWQLEAGADVLPGFGALPWLGVRMPVGASTTSLHWRTHERRLSLQWHWHGLTLRAGTDRLGRGAQSREFALGWRLVH